MSRIDKLAILGVRSFDNTRSETIQFHTPLTLIVGYNGSGKTTIIECLKYATTGLLPPNSKGGAFIHDPKMCGEKEVLAQVKLSFKSLNDAKMVCTRSMQLTIKKTTRSVKTLEGQLLVVRNGERAAISSRCAELDTIMPQYLGVSKAVLEYVIFCHQDESLWPMSEPSVLKKRFDEIFEALKYTKAIDNMKVVTKNQKIELGKLKILLEQYRVDKDRGERAKRQSDQLHEEIEDMRGKVKNITTELEEATRQQQDLFKTAQAFEETLATLKSKKEASARLRSNIQETAGEIQHIKESDEELQQMQAKFQQALDEYDLHVQNRRGTYSDAINELNHLRVQLSSKLSEQGRIEAENNRYKANLREREAIVREISIKHQVGGFEGDLDDSQVDEFINQMARMVRDQTNQLENLRSSHRRERQHVSDNLMVIRQEKESLETKRRYAQDEIQQTEHKIRQFQRDTKNLTVNDGQKEFLTTDLGQKVGQLQTAKAEFEAGAFDASIKQLEVQLKATEEQRDSSTEELGEVTRNAANMAQVTVLKRNKDVREETLSKLIAAKSSRITKVIGREWTEESVDDDLRRIFEQAEEDVHTATTRRDGISKQASQAETRYVMASDALKKMKQQAQTCKEKVVKSIITEDHTDVDVREYPQALREIEAEKQDAGRGDFLREYLSTAVQTLENKKCCVTCRREVNDPSEMSRIMGFLKTRLDKMAQDVGDQAMEELNTSLEEIRAAGPSYQQWLELTDRDIPEQTKIVESCLSNKESLKEQLEQLENDLREKNHRKAELQILLDSLTEITKIRREIREIEGNINSQSQSLAEGQFRNVEEIQTDIKKLNHQAKEYKDQIQQTQLRERRCRQQVDNLEHQVNDIRKRLSEIEVELFQLNTLTERINECQKSINAQNTIIRQTDADIRAIAPRLAACEEELRELDAKAADQDMKQLRTIQRLNESTLVLKKAQQDIRNFLDQGGLQQLERCQTEVQNMQNKVEEVQQQAAVITEEIAELDRKKANANDTERSIKENLRYRRDQRELEQLERDIEELEAQDAQSMHERYQRDTRTLHNRSTRLYGEKQALVGEMKQKDRELERLLQEYATNYADAKSKYTDTLAKVQTTTAAMNDLLKYSAALDKAVMKYHSIKMEEINRIIEELWKATYRGTDVDTIMIRSEAENAKGNRSYNYRVVMVKQDAEMDMRGRCSAGQRVLACIIIRLALAECFGINCGLIALDEPTTNLDHDNIKSLAKSLHDIIKTRMTQSNFQLIIITHDEDFLKEMQCQDYCDHYYRVTRNDRQKSIIERQSIAEVL